MFVSKLDSAKRQLEIAIRLFLNNEDPISIHTLSAASHTVLRDLCKKQGKESILKDVMVKITRPEKTKEFRESLSKAENFFKHADKDPAKLIKFHPDETEWFLWDVCKMYVGLTNDNPPIIKVFNVWFHSKHPNILKDPEFVKLLKQKIVELNLDYEDRRQFLDLLPYAQKIN